MVCIAPPLAEAIAAPQVCYRHCYTSFPFLGATNGGTFPGAGQSNRRDRCPHSVSRPPSNRHPALLVPQTDPSPQTSPLNPIFMLGGAPKAHEVCYENMVQRADRLGIMRLSAQVSRCSRDAPSDEPSFESGGVC